MEPRAPEGLTPGGRSRGTPPGALRLYTHSACLDHDPGAGHPERAARLQAIVDGVDAAFPDLHWHQAPRARRAQLLRVHTGALLARVLDTAVAAGSTVELDPDTHLSPGSAEAALRAAGAGIAAVDALLAGDCQRAFCAVRPPGHHATASTAMGFCLLNNIAVAAAHACERHGLSRVAVVDFDVHHGNGTEAIFATDPRVMYVSSHQAGLFPGSGTPDHHGVGNIVNRPLPAGAGSDAFRACWEDTLLPALSSFRPQLLLVSAGFDGHRADPLAQFALDATDYGWITGRLCEVADRHADGRLVSMLEGGYDLQALRECAIAHVEALSH